MAERRELAGWTALIGKAERQYGLVSRRQIDAALTRRQLDGYVARGVLVPAAPRVWRVSGVAWTWRGRVMAVCLSIGRPVAASHGTAARLWGVEDLPLSGLHVVVPPGRSGRLGGPLATAGVVVHHAQLPESSLAERHRLPVTTAARTVVDLARMLDDEALLDLAEELERNHHLDLGALRRERLARPRLPGGRSVDELLASWDEDPIGDSKWEDEVFRWLVEGGLPIPERQHQVALGNGKLAVLDLAYPAKHVAIEFDGFRFHRGRRRFDRDRNRLSELVAVGWRPILVTSRHQPDEVVDRVRRALDLQSDPAESVNPS